MVRALVPAFEARNPDLRVRVQQVPWSAAHEKLLTAYVGDSLPDAFQLGNTWIPELVALGALEPLDARIEASRDPARGLLRGRAGRGVVGRRDLRAALVRRHAPLLLSHRSLRGRRRRRRRRAPGRAGATPWRASAPRAAPRATRCCCRSPSGSPLAILALPARRRRCCATGDRYGDFASPRLRRGVRLLPRVLPRRPRARRAARRSSRTCSRTSRRAGSPRSSRGRGSSASSRRRLPPEFESALGDGAAAGAGRRAAQAPGVSLAGGASLALVRGSPRADAAWRWLAFLAEPEQQIAFHRALGRSARRGAAPGATRACARDPKATAFLRPARARARDAEDPRVGAHREPHRAPRGGGGARRGDARRRRSRPSTARPTRCSRSGAGSSRARKPADRRAEPGGRAETRVPGSGSSRRRSPRSRSSSSCRSSPRSRLSLTDFDLYAVADLANLRFVGPRATTRALLARPALLDGARATPRTSSSSARRSRSASPSARRCCSRAASCAGRRCSARSTSCPW